MAVAYLPLGDRENVIPVPTKHEAVVTSLMRLSKRKDFMYLTRLPEKNGSTLVVHWKNVRGCAVETWIGWKGGDGMEITYGYR